MELAARRFARWVLLIHLLLLAGAIIIVAFAAIDIYGTQRQQAIEQASKVQSLLAAQTARGIQDYYSSIIEALQLFRGAEEGESSLDQVQRNPPPFLGRDFMGPAVWQQLKSRADNFIVINQPTLQATLVYPSRDRDVAQQIIRQTGDWLKSVRLVSISPVYKLADGSNVNLIAVPAVSNGRTLFVAVVPIEKIDKQLQDVHARREMSAMLLDSNMHVMTAYDKSIIGMNIAGEGSSQGLKERAQKYIRTGTSGTELFETGFQLGSHYFERGIVSVEPVTILGQRWWLTIGSNLDGVDSMVHDTFRNALAWAVFLVISVTAILISTAVQMIRNRVRVERMRHEILTRELDQARKIQLAWLPKADDEPQHIDISAVNKPASHISGDFYNWFNLDHGRVCVVIGDVTGHGMAAAFLMATTQLLVKIVMPRAGTPGKCLEIVNRHLCKQIFNGQFVTMLILVIDREHHRLEIASAGHPAPLINTGEGFKPLSIEPQLVMGIERDTTYPTETISIPESISSILYTDGVVDTISPQDRRFQLNGLQQSLHTNEHPSPNAKALADRIINAVDLFRQGRELEDDLTLVALQFSTVGKPIAISAAGSASPAPSYPTPN